MLSKLLYEFEYCNIGDTYAFTDENTLDAATEYLDKLGCKYEKTENSYIGIYMLKIK